jgi:hypothetical protein
MQLRPENIHSILATDCGSTTTKAILIEKREEGYRLIVRGEAPTTVEAPFEDVTRGVLNAVKEIEELATENLAGEPSLETDWLRSRLLAWIELARALQPGGEEAELDDAMEQNLRALGYLD